jgi:acetyltransferase-like isoleucine patch superfamily enzyme
MRGYPFKGPHQPFGKTGQSWARFWLRFSGGRGLGRLAARLAALPAPPHKGRVVLAQMSPRGFIEPTATIYHSGLSLGKGCYIGDRVMLFQRKEGGVIRLADRVYLYRDVILETGMGGTIDLGAGTSLHPKTQLHANVSDIRIGQGVMIASNCSLYSYDHGTRADQPIKGQPLRSKGPIVIGDEAWLGDGVRVLSGVTIGKGAVIAAGSIVTRDIPEQAIACGSPAEVLKWRKPAEGREAECN